MQADPPAQLCLLLKLRAQPPRGAWSWRLEVENTALGQRLDQQPLSGKPLFPDSRGPTCPDVEVRAVPSPVCDSGNSSCIWGMVWGG